MDGKIPSFLDYHRKSMLTLDIPGIKGEISTDEWQRIQFKGYPRFERVPLPQPKFVGGTSAHKLLENRRSERTFSQREEVSLEEISRLMSTLRITTGLNGSANDSKRAYSSAGARYPIEAYILPLGVAELESHIYHYHVRSHSIEKLWAFSDRDFENCFPDEAWCGESAAAIILTACHGRNSIKYGERAYRYCLIEAGQIAQSMQLISASEGFACCNFGGFHDESVMRLLDINPNEEIVLHTLFFGRPG
jgi:SagB-type dehydrogenase family enzyme